MDGFVKYMEQTTGKKVVFFPVQSNAAEIEAMRSGRLHVAGFNTGSNPIAVNCAGFVPFAIMGTKDGQFGYEMELIVPADSPIKTPADLKGKKVAFTSPTSNSGFKAPSAILKADFNLEANRDFTPVFSGKHDNSVIGVANKDFDAAAIANEVCSACSIARLSIAPRSGRFTKSETFPTTGYGYAHNLDPALVEKIKQAFFTFLGGLRAEGRVQERGPLHPDHLSEGLERDPQDRRGERRQIHLQVSHRPKVGAQRMLRIKGLTKRYRTGDLALKGIDLDVPDGEVMALIGPSGAGKSTVIRCINRLLSRPPGRSRSTTPRSRRSAAPNCAARAGAWG